MTTRDDRREEPSSRFNRSKATTSAFTMVELLVVITAAIALLVLFLVYTQKAAARRQRIECVNNLKQVGLLCRAQGAENRLFSAGGNVSKVLTNTPETDVIAMLKTMTNLANPRVFVCPADRKRSPASSWSELSRDTVSYFFNLEGGEVHPNVLLSGDSNMTTNAVPLSPGIAVVTPGSAMGWTRDRHQNAGNVALGDGSVQQATSARLAEWISKGAPMMLWIP